MAEERTEVDCKPPHLWHKWEEHSLLGTPVRNNKARGKTYRCRNCGEIGFRTDAEFADGMPVTRIGARHYYERGDPDRGIVYFIAADSVGMVKIGMTSNLEQRLIDLRVACPVSLRVVYHRPGGRWMESDYHKKFAAYRSHGEWFRFEGELRSFIEIMVREAEKISDAQTQHSR